jgi:hypothetical protein
MGVESMAPSMGNPSFVSTMADEFDAAPKACRNGDASMDVDVSQEA